MIRVRCSGRTTQGQCKKTIRARIAHTFCRECYRIVTGESRHIKSRTKSDNKYRRTRSRRFKSTKRIPKAIANRNKQRGNNSVTS